MLVSLEWLNELVDIKDLKAEEIAEALTMSGLEVEEIEQIKPKFSKVFVGKILEVHPHPDASKIRLPIVDFGQGPQQVVCGAPNIQAGQYICFAVEGATVYSKKDDTTFKLKKAKIRGVESSGMICSAAELCLEGLEYKPFEEGVIILSEMERFKGQELELGMPIEKLLDLPVDTVLHTAPTANRGDQMSMRGVANEVASIFNRPRKITSIEVEENSLNSSEKFDVEIHDEDTCKYYAIGIVKELKIKPSPPWMAKRLESMGMRPINNIVDITNYVMLEYGQPLHAFDMDKLKEQYLSVRRAKEGEKIKTLDGMERNLVPDNVLIATKNSIVGLAGVMGDETSEVGDATKDLAIEAAYFTPATNRRNGRAVGLRTEASARFERGVDIKSVKLALKRTMQLMVELADAKTAGIFETGSDAQEPVIVELRLSQVKRILGIEIEKSKCIEILKNLDFVLKEESETSLKFEVPTYRTRDVYREIDLIEEISRIYGYDKIEETLPKTASIPEIPELDRLTNNIKSILMGKGLTEVVTSSLVGDPIHNWCNISYDDKTAVKVTNPQSVEYTMLRQKMAPSILQVVKYNFDHNIEDIWVFETGKTYAVTSEATHKEPGTTENVKLAGAIVGFNNSSLWQGTNNSDFYFVKGIVEDLFTYFNLHQRLTLSEASDIDYMHPYRTAYIDILGKPKNIDQPLGFFGQLHPEIQAKCKIPKDVYLFEIDLQAVLKCIPKTTTRYKQVAAFPAVTRDIAFLIDDKINYADVNKTIKKAASNLLKDTDIFDIYKGEHVQEGQKSFAIRITLQDPKATLTDDVVEAEVKKVKAALEEKFSVTLR